MTNLPGQYVMTKLVLLSCALPTPAEGDDGYVNPYLSDDEGDDEEYEPIPTMDVPSPE